MGAEHLTKVLKLTALERAIDLFGEHGDAFHDLGCMTILQDMVEALKTPAAMVMPTAEGKTDISDVVREALANRQWILFHPDGRMWQNENPLIIIAAISAVVSGAPDMGFEPPVTH